MGKNKNKSEITICFSCSTGGHLSQLLELRSIMDNYNHFFVTFKNKPSMMLSKTNEVHFVKNPERNILFFIECFLQTMKIFMRCRPDVIVTTGAGVAFPACIISKILGKKLIFIEDICRINNPSTFGRLVYPISDLTIVQWKSLLKFYKKAIYGGQLFDFSFNPRFANTKGDYIFITIGTHNMEFKRLLEGIDNMISSGSISNKVIAQIGHSRYKPNNYRHFSFIPYQKYLSLLKSSKLVITHGGIGSIRQCLDYNKKTIVFPRRKEFREHIDNHQLEITRELEKQGKIIPAFDIKQLQKAINSDVNSKIGDVPQSQNKNKIQDILEAIL